tara:strand:+ start:10554 stop:11468 length:915 start_codon:yes stop_codon:yes gene_type:complete
MEENPIVTIGIPVYNGEKTIEERIKNLMLQTFQNFVIILSDNNSSDKTLEKCLELAKRDNRINIFQQKKNMGPVWNTNFVLEKSKTKYFVWAAADDIWSDNFLEENIKILEYNENVVGSIGEVELFNRVFNEKTKEIEIKFLKNSKRYQYAEPSFGKFEDKIAHYLRSNTASMVYAIYRTEKLKKRNVFAKYKDYAMWRVDFANTLNMLKEGDFEVTINSHMYKEVTERSHSIIQYLRKIGYNFIQIISYNFPFTIWCLKNLGTKIFFKNITYFIRLNVISTSGLFLEVLRMCKRVVSGRPKYW